ncbi:hypothetical protein EON65_55430 [archaeon]|nr:MAG: hypothetical protein EON65_55430 [archaeon]
MMACRHLLVCSACSEHKTFRRYPLCREKITD